MSSRCVVLTGMMGAGKSEVGELLADQLGYDFYDTDKIIEKKSGMKISQMFAEHGEEAFREWERTIIKGMSGIRNAVVAVGGGALVDPANRQVLEELGHTVYLKASAQELYQRIKNDKTRPLLHTENPRETMKQLLKDRAAIYEQAADIVVDTEVLGVDEVVEVLINEMAKRTIESSAE